MQGLTGLNGIAGLQVQYDADSQATPEERMGGTVDPKHSEWGETAKPYPSQSNLVMGGELHGPYGPENQMLGDFDNWFLTPAGEMGDDPSFDRTPARRAAPYPKGVASGPSPGVGPDDMANQLRQSMVIHATNTGAGLKALTGFEAQQDEWVELLETNPGHTDLRPLDRQALSSGFMWGTRDRTQSMARQNEYGYDSAHMHRRYAVGAIPGNTMWMRPGGRPLAKSLPGPARPAIGQGSPFAGDDLGAAYGINGAILQNVPTEYTPPPQPNLGTVAPNDNDSYVEWY